ncbi:hypothetical protein Mucpa_2368 [Mucilaginibacter paludis DSM 18603]|uniref:Uncharacterized protein n=1 Tax=Mucilaginibacter paludis DSM 18603 TaxID=714943 RepID=H1YI63_9SPHI|nr:hypothetical protein Mucpa_2368 [Mucilaginibacter paludis DSM 18603]
MSIRDNYLLSYPIDSFFKSIDISLFEKSMLGVHWQSA